MMLLALFIILWASQAFAVTAEWPCNDEPDMKEYRLEYSLETPELWGTVATVPHVDGCASITYLDSRYLAPGRKRYRVFAGNTADRYSGPSPEALITIPVSPIGNPGGQTEQPLPPSPFVPDVPSIDPPPTPPPPVEPPPVEPPPVEPPPVEPPPVPVVTLKEAMLNGLKTCLDRKLAHTACMKALVDAIGKATQ